MPSRAEIGEMIKNARKVWKMTQEDLGKQIGVTKDTISCYENGKVKVIPLEKRLALADILDLDITRLWYSNEDMQKAIDKILEEEVSTLPPDPTSAITFTFDELFKLYHFKIIGKDDNDNFMIKIYNNTYTIKLSDYADFPLRVLPRFIDFWFYTHSAGYKQEQAPTSDIPPIQNK